MSQGLIVDEVNACSLDNLDLTAFGDLPDLDKTLNELLEKEIQNPFFYFVHSFLKFSYFHFLSSLKKWKIVTIVLLCHYLTN